MIEFQGLSKVYGGFNAVKPLNLTVKRGEVSASSAPTAPARPPPSA